MSDGPASALARRIAARHIVLEAGRVLSPGVIEWDERGRIVSLRATRGPVQDLAVLPGLVNAHVHLQIAPLAQPERSFLPWVRQVMAARGEQTPAGQRAAAREAMLALLADGTTAVGEIDSTGETAAGLAGLAVGGRCYRELTGYHLHGAAADELVRARSPRSSGHLRAGLSPHAPYSISADLVQAAARRVRHLAIHCAELPEEQRFLRQGDGPFADLLRHLRRLPANHRPRGVGAVAWLQQLEVLREHTQLVHCQELEPGDVARIRAAGASIAVCPGTIEYFQRTPPDVPAWIAAGIPVALGTDSQASNAGWSMRHELARAAALWPQLSPAQLLTMATAAGGRALGIAAGGLRRGRRADLLVVRAAGDWPDTLAGFVHGERQIEQVVLAGEPVER